MWQDTPLATVVRTGQPWVGPSVGETDDRHDDPASLGRYCLALPIHRWGHPMGALVITADQQPDLAADGTFWRGVAAA